MAAVFTDARSDKIPNRLIITGLFLGLGTCILEEGVIGIPHWILRISIPIILFYILFFFGTLGAYPDSDHARECMAKGEQLVSSPEQGNTIFGSWLCQGRIDPKVIETMVKMAVNVHPMTPERKARIEESSHHPDDNDLLAAQEFFRRVLAAVEL